MRRDATSVFYDPEVFHISSSSEEPERCWDQPLKIPPRRRVWPLHVELSPYRSAAAPNLPQWGVTPQISPNVTTRHTLSLSARYGFTVRVCHLRPSAQVREHAGRYGHRTARSGSVLHYTLGGLFCSPFCFKSSESALSTNCGRFSVGFKRKHKHTNTQTSHRIGNDQNTPISTHKTQNEKMLSFSAVFLTLTRTALYLLLHLLQRLLSIHLYVQTCRGCRGRGGGGLGLTQF